MRLHKESWRQSFKSVHAVVDSDEMAIRWGSHSSSHQHDQIVMENWQIIFDFVYVDGYTIAYQLKYEQKPSK